MEYRINGPKLSKGPKHSNLIFLFNTWDIAIQSLLIINYLDVVVPPVKQSQPDPNIKLHHFSHGFPVQLGLVQSSPHKLHRSS